MSVKNIFINWPLIYSSINSAILFVYGSILSLGDIGMKNIDMVPVVHRAYILVRKTGNK